MTMLTDGAESSCKIALYDCSTINWHYIIALEGIPKKLVCTV